MSKNHQHQQEQQRDSRDHGRDLIRGGQGRSSDDVRCDGKAIIVAAIAALALWAASIAFAAWVLA